MAVLIQVGLTLGLLFWLGPARVGALRRGEVRLKDIALGQNAWPDRITKISNTHNNQYQLPVLFYVLALAAILTRTVDWVVVAAAWVFVASRLLHAFIYVTSNDVPQRFRAFVAGACALFAMWGWLAARVLLEGS
jgi:hypothetical protein